MVEIITSATLCDAGFPHHGFCCRNGGHSAGPYASLNVSFDVGDDPATVARNLALIRTEAARERPLVRLVQVHGATVREAAVPTVAPDESWVTPPTLEGDALIAPPTRDAVLAVQTADCAPVLIADPKTRLYAAIHAGWRSTAKGIIRKTVRELTSRGASPADLVACVGPRIGIAHYEVGDEVVRHFPESADPIPKQPGKHRLDLGQAIEVSLIAAGLSTPHIDVLDTCTYEDEERWFSHRRSGGVCGRNLAFISQ